MKKFMSGLLALTLLAVAMPMSAAAQTVNYKQGVIESATAAGKSVLLHYKSTW